MGIETIEHAVGNVSIDGTDRSLQEIVYQRIWAIKNARIVLVGMQKVAEEIRAGRHPRINPDELRAYEIAIKAIGSARI